MLFFLARNTISIGANDQWTFPAKFQRYSLERLSRCVHNNMTNFSRACKCHLTNVLVMGNGCPCSRTIAWNYIYNTWWKSDFFNQGGEVEGCQWCLLCWFKNLPSFNKDLTIKRNKCGCVVEYLNST